jgi:hypothetical protein
VYGLPDHTPDLTIENPKSHMEGNLTTPPYAPYAY